MRLLLRFVPGCAFGPMFLMIGSSRYAHPAIQGLGALLTLIGMMILAVAAQQQQQEIDRLRKQISGTSSARADS